MYQAIFFITIIWGLVVRRIQIRSHSNDILFHLKWQTRIISQQTLRASWKLYVVQPPIQYLTNGIGDILEWIPFHS